MPSIEIRRVLPGEGLEECIGQFTSALSCSPFSTWLILPTERLADSVREVLARRGVPYVASRICTLEGFCRNYFGEHRTTTRSLSSAESRILLSQVLVRNRELLPVFFPRSHPLPGTLDDLRTFMSVVTMRKVVFPECLLELQSDKSDQIDLIISEYRSTLRELDMVDSDTLLEWTIDHLAASGPGPARQVFLYGIHKPLPLEQDLLSVLREQSGSYCCFIPAGLDPDIFDGTASPGETTGALVLSGPDPSYAARLTGLFSEPGPIDAGRRIRLSTFPTHYAELQGIAEEICRLHDSGIPLADISVAFPEVREEFGIIDEVFSDYGIPWNARTAPRLSRSPVIRFLTGIIGVVAGRYAREDVVRMVNSPYFRPGGSPDGSRWLDPGETDLVSRHAMIEGDRKAWLENLDRLSATLSGGNRRANHAVSPQMVDQVRRGMGFLLEQLRGLEGRRSVPDFVRAYRKFLEIRGLPHILHAADRGIETEQAVVDTFLAKLDALSHAPWLSRDQKVTTDEFLRIVTTIADEPGERPGHGAGGVQILGIRECAHQHIPCLFICGLYEGAVPRLTTRLPFTNSLENARMGTRSLAEILHEQEYYFIAALLSAERIFLSAPRAEGDKSLLTSPFFEQVRERCNPEEWTFSAGEEVSPSRSISAIRAGEHIAAGRVCQAAEWTDPPQSFDSLVERINMERYFRTGTPDSPFDGILPEDGQIPALLSEQFGPGRVYSPTSLETYAQCPFRFFLRNVLHLEDLPEPEPNLSPADRGTAIHDILTTFYRQWRSSGKEKICRSSLAEAGKLMQAVVDAELAGYPFRSPIWEATCNQMRGYDLTGPGIFERFLARESEEETSPLVPTYFEFSFGMEPDTSDDPASAGEAVELSGSGGSGQLRIRGRIDRIDLSPEGSFLIYDYKTGQAHPGAGDIEAGRALQLPLYLLAFESLSGKRGVAAGYYRIRKDVESRILLCDETGRELIASRPKISPDFAGTLARSCDFALDYIRRIRKGEFPLPPGEKCPNDYCEFRRVCRFDPYRAFESSEVS